MLGNAAFAEEVYDEEILWEDETSEMLEEEAADIFPDASIDVSIEEEAYAEESARNDAAENPDSLMDELIE